MKAQIYVDSDKVGEADLQIIDISMGVVGGQVTASPLYSKYRTIVRQRTNSKGGANVTDLNFSVKTEGGSLINAEGGITLIDSLEFDEFTVEIAGVDLSNFDGLRPLYGGL